MRQSIKHSWHTGTTTMLMVFPISSRFVRKRRFTSTDQTKDSLILKMAKSSALKALLWKRIILQGIPWTIWCSFLKRRTPLSLVIVSLTLHYVVVLRGHLCGWPFSLLFPLDVLGHGTAVFEDLPVYLSSLQRMQNRVSGRGYPGHGAVIEDAATKITEYINHRQQREEEVIRVLRYGKLDIPDNEPSPERKSSWTPIEIVKVIYRNVPESLHLPASHGVLQVLMKLEAEGKVVHDIETGKWRIDIGKSALWITYYLLPGSGCLISNQSHTPLYARLMYIWYLVVA